MLNPIAHRQRDGITSFHADGQETVGESIYARIQIRVTNLTKAIFHRDLNRKFPSVAAQAVTHQHRGRIHKSFGSRVSRLKFRVSVGRFPQLAELSKLAIPSLSFPHA